MPTGIAPSDQKLLLAGGTLLLLMLVASALLSPRQEQTESPVPSTYSTQSAGAEAAYRLLIKLNYPVRRWENPPTELDSAPEHTLLILAEPLQAPSQKERQALADFVEDGGHVLFTGGNIRDYFADAVLSSEVGEPSWTSYPAVLPTRLSRGVRSITLKPQAYWAKLAADQLPLYGDPAKPVVVAWAFGDGEILWWAGSTPLTNAGITHDDNLVFFLNSFADWSPDEPYHIYWDEYFHGQRSSLWSYVAKTSLAWSALQISVLALAILFTFARRRGPVFVPPQPSRLSPLEFVDTLGGLYERAGAASSAISVSMVRLRALLTRQLGLPSNTPTPELARVAVSRMGWKDAGLEEILRRADSSAQSVKFPPRDALDIVQNLEKFSAKLDLRSQIRREKT
jgi:hypothetical protein